MFLGLFVSRDLKLWIDRASWLLLLLPYLPQACVARRLGGPVDSSATGEESRLDVLSSRKVKPR